MAGLLLAGSTLPGRAQSTWYVATTGNNANNGTGSWAQALATISNAVVRSSASDTILVSNGTYGITADILVNKDVKILGLNRDTTIVQRSGGQTNRIFYISSAGALVANLTITGGLLTNLASGGGIYMLNGTVSNCLIAGNAALNFRTGWGGGGVCMENGTVQGCVIRANQATDYPATTNLSVGDCGGGGVYMRNGNLRDSTIENNTNYINGAGGMPGGGGIMLYNGMITNCIIQSNKNIQAGTGWPGGGGIGAHNRGTIADCDILNNYTTARGGGIYLQATDVRVLRCRIIGNQCVVGSNSGGGGLAFNSGGIMENCLVANNLGNCGIAMGYYGTSQMRNCTVVGHTYGLIESSINSTNGRVINTIIAYNTAADLGSAFGSGIPSLTNIMYYTCSTQLIAGVNSNLSALPMLSNIATSNFNLAPISPCINAGTNGSWTIGATDLAGTRRIDVFLQPIADMGAYEFHPSGTMFSGR